MDYETTLGNGGFTRRGRVDKAVASLEGILTGITIDQAINEAEARELQNWLSDHRELARVHPFTEVVTVVNEALADGVLDAEEREDLLWLTRQLGEDGVFWDATTSCIQRLHGIFHGILADGVITDGEIRGLSDWVEEHEMLKGLYPYDELESFLTSILADGRIDGAEREGLATFLGQFIQPSLAVRMGRVRAEKDPLVPLSGFCAVGPALRFEGAAYCWTGASTRATRQQITGVITAHGARFTTAVSGQTDYLVVGAAGNPAWAFSCYGRKVEQAVAHRREGARVTIVHETDFWDALLDQGWPGSF